MQKRDELLGKRKTGKNRWMSNDECIAITMDESIPVGDKTKLLEGEYKSLAEYQRIQSNNIHREIQNRNQNLQAFSDKRESNDQLYADLTRKLIEKEQIQVVRKPTRKWTDAEIQAADPIHIDERLQSLDHIRPSIREMITEPQYVDSEPTLLDERIEKIKDKDPKELNKRISEMKGVPLKHK